MYPASRARYSICALACLGLLLGTTFRLPAQLRSVLVRVLDEQSHRPITTAVLRLGQQHYPMNSRGEVRFSYTPQTADSLHLHALGYIDSAYPIASLAPHTSSTPLLLYLKRELRMLSGVQVAGQRRSTSVNSVTSQLSEGALQRNLGRSLGQLLSEVSGVTTLQTGTTTAKPVIHGMYGTRVLIVNQGVRQSGQQWGEDHAPEVDIEGNSRIQVVKGAEAVRYGAEAMAGAVLLDAAPLPYQLPHLHGRVGSAYASNGRRTSTSVALWGGLTAHPEWAYRLQASYTNAGDRHTADYALTNTGMREINYSLALGWKQAAWQVEGFFSQYNNKTGLLPSGHLRSREGMAELLEYGRPDPELSRPFSRDIASPYHAVKHYLAKLKASYRHERWGSFEAQLSHQWDHRDEYAIRRNSAFQHVPTLSLALHSTQLDGQWRQHYQRWDSEVGLHGEWMDNYSNAGTGFTPPIPNYAQRAWGLHAIQRYTHSRYGAELGLRLDQLSMGVAGYDFLGNYFDGAHHFTNLTYSLGAHLSLPVGWRLTSSFGLAWRAPHVQELYSYGSMHGSAIFVYGDRTLRSERGYKWITSLTRHSPRLDLRLDGYLQWIDGYIYDEPSHGEYARVITGEYPVFRYKQRDAFFRGVDLDGRYFFLPQRLYLGVKGSMIWANERGTGRYFPYIPALRLREELGWQGLHLVGGELSCSLSHSFVDRQHRFDPETDLTTPPEAYHLFGLEASFSRSVGTHHLTLNLSIDNLLNQAYKEYTNRARYYAHDAGRDVRLSLHWTF